MRKKGIKVRGGGDMDESKRKKNGFLGIKNCC
jgi:hypothetical protein